MSVFYAVAIGRQEHKRIVHGALESAEATQFEDVDRIHFLCESMFHGGGISDGAGQRFLAVFALAVNRSLGHFPARRLLMLPLFAPLAHFETCGLLKGLRYRRTRTMLSEQIKAGRAMLRWRQQTLSDASNVSLATIKRIELTPGRIYANKPTLNAIVLAFAAAGVELHEGDEGFSVKLARKARRQSVAPESVAVAATS